jgi:hypothetical protein
MSSHTSTECAPCKDTGSRYHLSDINLPVRIPGVNEISDTWRQQEPMYADISSPQKSLREADRIADGEGSYLFHGCVL